jgi:hypothetical protein
MDVLPPFGNSKDQSIRFDADSKRREGLDWERGKWPGEGSVQGGETGERERERG